MGMPAAGWKPIPKRLRESTWHLFLGEGFVSMGKQIGVFERPPIIAVD
jgi:hypothetical protein